MDIQSYLLGKNSAGGGDGSDLDWTALGYTDRPQAIDDGYNYAKKYKKNGYQIKFCIKNLKMMQI